jgi:copper chaperone CopZ
METIQLKTNIKCSGCIAKATPFLNEVVGEDNWEVNIKDPNKVLTVAADKVTKNDIIKAVEKAGYTAMELS